MTVSPESHRIGWIGTGVMGASMAGHLQAAGYKLTVYTRTKAKAQSLIDAGADWAASPGAVAAASDIVFSIVGKPDDVQEVLLGVGGAVELAKPGSVIVDMTTSTPSLAVEIAERAAAKSIQALDAPVSGGDVGAKNGTLSIMIGGDADTVESLASLWDLMGSRWVLQGGPGAGQHTKMVNQTLVATGMIGICEALLYAERAGLDLPTVLESVSSGAAGSWSLSNLAPRIIGGNFDPGFFVEHFIKDLGIVLAEAKRMGLSLPGLALAEQLYLATAAQGHAKLGTHALMLALADLNGKKWTA